MQIFERHGEHERFRLPQDKDSPKHPERLAGESMRVAAELLLDLDVDPVKRLI
jgi:hypothetical protein